MVPLRTVRQRWLPCWRIDPCTECGAAIPVPADAGTGGRAGIDTLCPGKPKNNLDGRGNDPAEKGRGNDPAEISQIKNNISGCIRMGAGESIVFHYLSRTAAALAEEYPDIRFHVISGDTQDLMDDRLKGNPVHAFILSFGKKGIDKPVHLC